MPQLINEVSMKNDKTILNDSNQCILIYYSPLTNIYIYIYSPKSFAGSIYIYLDIFIHISQRYNWFSLSSGFGIMIPKGYVTMIDYGIVRGG